TERAAEVLLSDDVRRVERPLHRELDVGLEEGVATVFEVRDARVAPLPLQGLVRIDTRVREVPADPDAQLLRRLRHVRSCPLRPLSRTCSRVASVHVRVPWGTSVACFARLAAPVRVPHPNIREGDA